MEDLEQPAGPKAKAEVGRSESTERSSAEKAGQGIRVLLVRIMILYVWWPTRFSTLGETPRTETFSTWPFSDKQAILSGPLFCSRTETPTFLAKQAKLAGRRPKKFWGIFLYIFVILW